MVDTIAVKQRKTKPELGDMTSTLEDATKSKALAALARSWDIAQSEIVAFGDDLNDIDMLSFVALA